MRAAYVSTEGKPRQHKDGPDSTPPSTTGWTNRSFWPSSSPLNYRSTVWRWHFITQLLKAQSLSLTDVVWTAGGADEPAVVHATFQPPVFIVALPLQPLGLFHLPAQLQHQGVRHHFRRLASWAPMIRLAPAEPRHAASFSCSLLPVQKAIEEGCPSRTDAPDSVC